MNRIPERAGRAAARSGLAFLLLVPPMLGGGESSVALLAIHTVLLLVFAFGPGLDLTGAAARLPLPLAAFGAACGWAAVSFLRASYRFGSFVSLFDLILFFLLFLFVAGGSWSDRDRRGARICVVSAATVQAVWALIQVGLVPGDRPAAGFVNTNHLAAYLVVGFWAAVGLAVEIESRRGRIAAAATGLLQLIAVFATGSRGALAALVAVLVLAVTRAFRGNPRRTIAAAAVVAILAGVAGAAVVQRFRSRDDPYSLGRVRIWPAVMRVAADHPVVGVGPGMLESRASNYNPPEPGATVRYSKRFLSAHSSYLQVLAETGVPGLVLALAAAVSLLRRLFRGAGPARPRFPWLGFTVVTLMLHGLVENLVGVPGLALAVLILTGLEACSSSAPAAVPARPAAASCLPVSLLGITAVLYLYWSLVWSPFLADRQFGRMRSATDAAGFLRHMEAAVSHNRFQPYYYWEGAVRVLRGSTGLELESFAVTHGWLKTAIELEPGEPRFHREMARLYARAFLELFRDQPTRNRALEAYDAAFARNRTDPRPLVEKARFQRLAGMAEAGLDALRAAIGLEPAYAAARLERLEILDGLGRIEEFRRELADAEPLLRTLQAYRPRNEYERSIVAIDPDRWNRLLPPAATPTEPLP